MSKTKSTICAIVGLGLATVFTIWTGTNTAWDAFTLYFGAVFGMACIRLIDAL